MTAIFKRTKILATLGPTTSTPEKIEKLIIHGVNGFRLNFSHGDHSERDQQIEWIRSASKKLGKPVAILQDLQGPKIRLGVLKDNVRVETGDELVLDHSAEHDGNFLLPIQYNLAEKVKPDEPLYIFDGKIRTTVVEKISDTAIKVRVENPGVLSSKKGINLPDTDFGGDILTQKDIRDVEYGAQQDIDYVALSFVQSAEDIDHLRQMLVGLGSEAQIIAKIETKAAIKPGVLEAIVRASDGVMVARGDLAVEAGAEIVPVVQRRIIALCRRYGRLSIVATQMMASMVDAPEPTRAEVSDVAGAVVQGADTVMLSDETANGNYPFETVDAMKRVILYTQENVTVRPTEEILKTKKLRQNAIAHAAVDLAEQLGVRAIIAETKSGATAANIAVHRPNLPIISVTSSARAAQQLALSYANKSFIRPDGEKAGLDLAKQLWNDGFFAPNEESAYVVIVSGKQPGLAGGTDTIRVRMLE